MNAGMSVISARSMQPISNWFFGYFLDKCNSLLQFLILNSEFFFPRSQTCNVFFIGKQWCETCFANVSRWFCRYLYSGIEFLIFLLLPAKFWIYPLSWRVFYFPSTRLLLPCGYPFTGWKVTVQRFKDSRFSDFFIWLSNIFNLFLVS